jgi:hypothetical protein
MTYLRNESISDKMKRERLQSYFLVGKGLGFILKNWRDEITSLQISIAVLVPDGLSNLHHRECSLAAFRYTVEFFWCNLEIMIATWLRYDDMLVLRQNFFLCLELYLYG